MYLISYMYGTASAATTTNIIIIFTVLSSELFTDAINVLLHREAYMRVVLNRYLFIYFSFSQE